MTASKYFLSAERVSLRPLLLSDVESGYLNWLNDPEVCRYNSHRRFPFTYEVGIEFIRKTWVDKTQLVLAVVLNHNNQHIGNVALQRIDRINRNAEFAILMGEKQYWGLGYSKEAAILLFKHGFSELNLHRIYCGTNVNNTGMQKLALSLNMKQEGHSREAQFKSQQYSDILHFGVLRKDFKITP
jgi:[ribosomal protein S5]-alanine N-acetyltransferase